MSNYGGRYCALESDAIKKYREKIEKEKELKDRMLKLQKYKKEIEAELTAIEHLINEIRKTEIA